MRAGPTPVLLASICPMPSTFAQQTFVKLKSALCNEQLINAVGDGRQGVGGTLSKVPTRNGRKKHGVS